MRRVELHEIPERFWAKVDRRGPDDCWIYGGPVTRGYGMFWLRDGLVPGAPADPSPRRNGRMHSATRVAWYLSRGAWPDADKDMCHHCDNPPCANPSHLWAGTAKENAQDMVRKGRQSRQGAPGGECHPFHKLTDAQVREVLALLAAGERTQRSIADEYGVSQALISAYHRGIRRADVTAA